MIWYFLSLVGFFTFGKAEPGTFDGNSRREREEGEVVVQEEVSDDETALL